MAILKTALITGASSGIGASLAHQFGRNKYNLVLVARDENKLLNLKYECEKKYSVEVRTLSCDLSQVDVSLNAIQKIVEGWTIDALVNNACFGVHGDFIATSLDKELDMLQLQTKSVVTLTKYFLPGMVDRKYGEILNVASVYSFTPVPYQAVYGACKSFLLSFSLSLAHEMKQHGIRVTALCPGTTDTNFRKRSKIKEEESLPLLKGMSSDSVAECGFKALQRGNLVSIPGAKNKFIIGISTFIPSKILSSMVSFINEKRGVNHI